MRLYFERYTQTHAHRHTQTYNFLMHYFTYRKPQYEVKTQNDCIQNRVYKSHLLDKLKTLEGLTTKMLSSKDN